MAILETQQRISIGLEATAGTQATTLNAIIAGGIECTITPTKAATDDMTTGGVPAAHPYGGEYASVAFSTGLYVRQPGSNLSKVNPLVGPLLEACGMTKTEVSNSVVRYDVTALTPGQKSVTIVWQAGNLRKVLTYGRGTFTIDMTPGNQVRANFTFEGYLESYEGNATALPAPARQPTAAPVFSGNSFAATDEGSVALQVDGVLSGTLDIGNALERTTDITHSSGFGPTFIARREPSLTFETRLMNVGAAVQTLGTRLNLSDKRVSIISTWSVKNVATQKIDLAFPNAEVTTNPMGAQGGVLTESLTAMLTGHYATDTPMSLTFTDTTIT